MKKLFALSFLFSAFALVGCNGSSESSGTSSGNSLSGTAAIGAPIANGVVEIIGNGNCKKTGTTNSTGRYSIPVVDCEGPYLLRVSGKLGTLHSIAKNEDVGKTVNITPLTELVTARTLGTNDLVNTTSVDEQKVSDSLDTVKAEIKAVLQPLLDNIGVGTVDIMNASFSANGQGLDRVLDAIEVKKGSSTDMNLKIKGGSDIVISSDVADSAPAPVDASEVTAVDTQLQILDGSKILVDQFVTAINNSTAGNMTSVFHADFKHNGSTTSEFLADLADPSQGETLRIHSPVIAKYDENAVGGAEITLILQIDEYYNGQKDGSFTEAMRFKNDGAWKFYGNQLNHEIYIDPAIIALEDGTMERVLRVGYDGSDDLSAGISFSLNGDSGTLTYHPNSPAYLRFPSSLRPSCAAVSEGCEGMYRFADSDALPAFIPITIDGVETFVSTPPHLPEDDSKFAVYEYAQADLCGLSIPFEDYPTSIGFSVPTGMVMEGHSFGPINSSLNFSFSSVDWESIRQMRTFPVVFENTGSEVTVDLLESYVVLADKSANQYIRIIGCSN